MDDNRKKELNEKMDKIEALALQVLLAKIAGGEKNRNPDARFDSRIYDSFTLAEEYIDCAEESRENRLERGY